MACVGIIAEFNPFHNGHRALLEYAKNQGTVVCAMSGNFVQRGDVAVTDKRLRAQAALLHGADLVLELPLPYAMSTAQNFALGGVSILQAAGCDAILFGSECGDITALQKACDVLQSTAFQERLSAYLKTGMSFAAARDKAADLGDLLSAPNNNLGIEYMLAARRIGLNVRFQTIKRQGAGHHDDTPSGRFASATTLRERLLHGDFEECAPYMPKEMLSLLDPTRIADISRLERAILAVLRTKTLQDLQTLPDLSEGLENKLFSAVSLANSLQELYNTVKVKRYSHARIRRLVLSAFLGLDNAFFGKVPPYARVLGFSRAGERLIRSAADCASVPPVLRTGDIAALSESAQHLFQTECRAADLYALAFEPPGSCGSEWTAKLIKSEC